LRKKTEKRIKRVEFDLCSAEIWFSRAEQNSKDISGRARAQRKHVPHEKCRESLSITE
jgi:hypothetical protein